MRENSQLLNSLFESDCKKEKINEITEKIIGCSYKVMNIK
jgi:hypothetical protein